MSSKGKGNKRKREPSKDKQPKSKKKKTSEEGEEKKEKQIPKTLDNTREFDETIVAPDDEEVFEDEQNDEFASYFDRSRTPKVLITTTIRPTVNLLNFVKEMKSIVGGNVELRPRKVNVTVKEILNASIERDFTDVLIFSEHNEKPHTLTLVHLPNGPTAQFKITGFLERKEIRGHGNPTDHTPELILNNFSTRLGHTVGRMFASLFPHDPEFVGRRVVTFHNQRDFIFFRQHRYIFDGPEAARLQELGPRFTLRLRWLQKGLFSIHQGEYEWHQKKEIETSRRRFFL